jgi:prephenate dehydrogenase
MSLNICIVGFGCFGQFLYDIIPKGHKIIAVDKDADVINSTCETRVLSLSDTNKLCWESIDVFIFAVSIASLDEVLNQFQPNLFIDKLVVDVCSVKVSIVVRV